MKKWMYVIFPGAMLAVFLVFYVSARKQMDEKENAHTVEVAQKKKADDERKARLQQESNEAQAKKAKERDDERMKKEADKLAKWKAEGDKIQDETDKAKAEVAANTKKIADLSADLAKLRTQRDQANREYLDTLKKVELAKIDRRNAELQIQRMTQMVTNRAMDSSLTKPPAPVVPPASPRS